MSHVLPRAGDEYVQRKHGSIVEITEVVESGDTYAVTFRVLPVRGAPHAPVRLFASDFHAEYTPRQTRRKQRNVDMTLQPRERWYSVEHQEIVTIIDEGPTSETKTVGASSGRTRIFRSSDFADSKLFTKILLRTIFDRLREE